MNTIKSKFYFTDIIKLCNDLNIPQNVIDDITTIFKTRKLIPCEYKFLHNCLLYTNYNDIINTFNTFCNIPPVSKKKNSIEMHILRYGPIHGPKKYAEKNKKCTVTKESYIKNHGVDEYNKVQSKKIMSIDSCIRRYGNIEGPIKFNNFCQRNKGNHSLERKIEKHGAIKGLELFQASRANLKHIHGLDGYIERYGKIEGTEKYHNKIDKMHLSSKRGYSNISQDFFWAIIEDLKGKDLKYIKFQKCGGEISKGKYKIDFIDLKQNKIIEFFGDRFHANPLIFDKNDTPNPFRPYTSEYIWSRDKEKIDYLHSQGFKILIIWEKEVKEDKQAAILKCKQFLNYD